MARLKMSGDNIDGDGPMKKLLLMILFISVATSSLFAGWSEPMRLTYRGNEIDPQVVVRNDTVHVAWQQSDGAISYIRSTNNGLTWDQVVDLTETGHAGSFLNLIVTDEKIWVGWMDDNGAIAIRSTFNGGYWNAPIYKYTIDSQRFTFPRLTVCGDTVLIAYMSSIHDSTGLSPYKFLKSSNGGQTWSNLEVIGHVPVNASVSGQVLSYCSGNLIFATDHDIDSLGNAPHITGYVSYDKGDHWSEPILISPAQTDWALFPSLSCSPGTYQLAVGYKDYRYQQYPFYGDIFARLSELDPNEWLPESQVTENHAAKQQSISLNHSKLVCVWSDRTYFSTGDDEISFNSSTDAGITWEGAQRLTYTPTTSAYPWVYNNNDTIHIVWYEDDLVNHSRDIYYIKYAPDSSNIINSDTPIPSSFKISAYPNPFNSTLAINIDSEKSGSIYISDILGRFITELRYPKGASTIKWAATGIDGKPLPSGAYFIKNKGGEYKDVLKVMYLK
jgi:hypothetical protein